jgi:hypothetical protein
MHRCFPLFLALALPAFAAEPVGVAEFEAFATGKTLSYAVGGTVVSRKLWKFSGVALRAFEGLFFQAARSRGIGSIG